MFQIADIEEFAPLQAITHFAALVANFDEGFKVIYEPHDEREPDISDPKLQLCCLDASIAIKPVFARYSTVVITSGTLSPLDMYPKLLECRPAVVGRVEWIHHTTRCSRFSVQPGFVLLFVVIFLSATSDGVSPHDALEELHCADDCDQRQ